MAVSLILTAPSWDSINVFVELVNPFTCWFITKDLLKEMCRASEHLGNAPFFWSQPVGGGSVEKRASHASEVHVFTSLGASTPPLTLHEILSAWMIIPLAIGMCRLTLGLPPSPEWFGGSAVTKVPTFQLQGLLLALSLGESPKVT